MVVLNFACQNTWRELNVHTQVSTLVNLLLLRRKTLRRQPVYIPLVTFQFCHWHELFWSNLKGTCHYRGARGNDNEKNSYIGD